MLFALLLSFAFSDIKMLSITSQKDKKMQSEFLMAKNAFKLSSKDTSSALIADYSKQEYYVIDYQKKEIWIYSQKNLYIKSKLLKKKQKDYQKKLSKIENHLIEELIENRMQEMGISVDTEKLKIKKDQGSRIKYNAYKEKRLIKTIWLKKAKSLKMNKKDMSFVKKAMKSFLFFQYTNGLNSQYSIEDMYYQVLKKKRDLVLDEAKVYPFDLRYPTHTKVKQIKKVKHSKKDFALPFGFKRKIIN